MSVESPRPPIPSLNALRAFEAAARHESFVDAAEELHVTAGAIAQQIKMIEGWAKQPLFDRFPHGVRLTNEARSVLPDLVDAFDELGSAVQRLRDVSRPRELRIAALPAIAMLWLQPRLTKLYRDSPDLEISVSAMEQPPDFSRELYDVALFFVSKIPSGVQSVNLSEDMLWPVGSPDLLRNAAIESPQDLEAHTLLHDSVWSSDWERWLSYATGNSVRCLNTLTFSLYSLAVQAAIESNGVLIGHTSLIRHALDRGELMPLFSGPKLESTPLKLLFSEDWKKRRNMSDIVFWFIKDSKPANHHIDATITFGP